MAQALGPPASLVGDPAGAPASWLQPGTVLAVVSIQEENLQREALALFSPLTFSHFLSAFKKMKTILKN